MGEVEFKVEPKKAKLTIGDVSVVGRFPTRKERKEFLEELEKIKPEEVVQFVSDFFLKLGFSEELTLELDEENYKDFYVFILNGKKN